MIVKALIFRNKNLKGLHYYSLKLLTQCSSLKKNESKQSKATDIIQKQYQQVNLPGSERNLSSLSELQSKILQQGKFDIMNPQIQPKMTPIKTFTGIDTVGITQINLGQVKVKSDDEVFLSQVDPHNIPEDLNIKFDYKKTLTLIGRQVTSQNQNKRSNIMKVSGQSFQEMTIEQMTQKNLGLGFKYELNKKQILRTLLIHIPIILLIFNPFIETFIEYIVCLISIRDIQEADIKQIRQIKDKYKRKALLENPNFNNWKRTFNTFAHQELHKEEHVRFLDHNKQADEFRQVSKRISR